MFTTYFLFFRGRLKSQKGEATMSSNAVSTLLERIPDGMARGWSLIVDGFELRSSRGSLFYGKSPSGNWDQWSFHEAGGGGSVTVPFALVEGSVYIGVVRQPRPLQDRLNPVLNIPRGFLDPGETHFQAAERESIEELGIKATFQLPGDPANPNSTFFETWDEGEGVRFFGLELNQSLLVADGNEYLLNPQLVKPVSKSGEGIMGARFISWQKAAMLGDLFTRGGVASLIGHLVSVGRLNVTLA